MQEQTLHLFSIQCGYSGHKIFLLFSSNSTQQQVNYLSKLLIKQELTNRNTF